MDNEKKDNQNNDFENINEKESFENLPENETNFIYEDKENLKQENEEAHYENKTDFDIKVENSFDDKNISSQDLLNIQENFWTKLFSKDSLSKIANFMFYPIFFALIFVILTNVGYNSFYNASQVSGASMQPTFNALHTKITDPLSDVVIYRWYEEYERGDVIIAKHNGTPIIKRIIALGGDRIKIAYNSEQDKYCVMLNGEALEENYIADEYMTNAQEKVRFDALYKDDKFNCRQYFDEDGYLVIPENYVFYMGDNRVVSLDCVEYGPQPIDVIEGKAVYKFTFNQSDDSITMFFTRVKVLFGNLFNNLEPNF